MNKIFMELITYPMFNIELSVNIKPGICKKKYAKATKKDQLIFEDYIFNIIKKQSTK